MKIDTVKIRNFRSIGGSPKEWGLVFRPHDGLNLIIGPNGSGKTTVIKAIELVLNSDLRSSNNLINEYDFHNCDINSPICIEVVLTDLEELIPHFDSAIQWIDPSNGDPIEENEFNFELNNFIKAIIIRFEAFLDQEDGEIKWRWTFPKFSILVIEDVQEVSRSQHKSIDFFHIAPSISSGSFSLSPYSVLGRHLKKLQYKLAKMPDILRCTVLLPECNFEKKECKKCPEFNKCSPFDGLVEASNMNDPITIGQNLGNLFIKTKIALGFQSFQNFIPSFGPRFAGMSNELNAMTLGMLIKEDKSKFIPFEYLSGGEKYALSLVLATTQIPNSTSPIIIIEEPETALHPSAVSAILDQIQSQPNNEKIQIFVTSHSETVLRNFTPKQIHVIGRNNKISSLKTVLENNKPLNGPFNKPDHLLMPAGATALLNDKILLVEGAGETIMSVWLNQLASRISSVTGQKVSSFVSRGWSIFNLANASAAMDTAKVLKALNKQVAILFDGDDAGLKYSEQVKSIYPTYVFFSNTHKDPCLEEALLYGLPDEQQNLVRDKYFNNPSCSNCILFRQECWRVKKASFSSKLNDGVIECPYENKDNRKSKIQELCINQYWDNNIFPYAFSNLLNIIDNNDTGDVTKININSSPVN